MISQYMQTAKQIKVMQARLPINLQANKTIKEIAEDLYRLNNVTHDHISNHKQSQVSDQALSIMSAYDRLSSLVIIRN